MCRDTLEKVERGSYLAVLTKTLEREWQTHLSRYSQLWLIAMRSRRRVVRVSEDDHLQLLVTIQQSCASDAIRAIVTKDYHLIGAALSTDQVLITIDCHCVSHFRDIASSVPAIASITVADPELEGAAVIDWLAGGAPAMLRWQLGHR